ncbi:MAG: M67 family metallopeptidase [bacterium]|nr:M67 family metallopeptidase [bacterium]
METLKIPKSIYENMISHAKELNPVECCGYLAGKDGVIHDVYRMRNLDDAPDHFTFDPKEQFSVMKDARAKGNQLLSVYHSHPETPARLSVEDLRLLKDPNTVYIIVSLLEPISVKGFRIVGEVVSEVLLVVT